MELKKTVETLQLAAGSFSKVYFSLFQRVLSTGGDVGLFIQLVEELKAGCRVYAAVWILFADLCDISHM